MRCGTIVTLLVGALVLGAAAQESQQDAGVRVAIGFGVDTVRSPNREIFELWRIYLSSRPDSLRPSPLWSAAEQAKWPDFDLVRQVYQGFPKYTVVHLAPAPGLDSTYLIRTLVAGVFDPAQDVKPLALYRTYATREGGRWVIANALPRMTRNWKREAVGHITFVYPPAHVFNRARARASAAFVDSLAHAFALPEPTDIGYYFAENMDEIFRAMGLDYFPLGPDTAGGRSNVVDKLVFVGSSAIGEGHRHELAHVVFAPRTSRRTAWLVSEGLATWAGGSAGLGYRDLLPGLKRYVQLHPELTLRGIMDAPPAREGTLDVGYDAFAVLCQMVFDHGGPEAIRKLAAAGTAADDVLPAAARLLDVPPAELDSAWRRAVLRSAR